MNPNVKYVFKSVSQMHAFILECVTTVFPAGQDGDDDDDDDAKQLGMYVWKDSVDRFLLCFKNGLCDKIAESVNTSSAIVVDNFRALQIFEDTIIDSDEMAKRLYPMYATVLDRFMAELDGHRDRLKVSVFTEDVYNSSCILQHGISRIVFHSATLLSKISSIDFRNTNPLFLRLRRYTAL